MKAPSRSEAQNEAETNTDYSLLPTKANEQTDSFISQRHGGKEIVHYFQFYTAETNKQKNHKSEGQEARTNKHQQEPSFFL